jgi:hypothetical protein
MELLSAAQNGFKTLLLGKKIKDVGKSRQKSIHQNFCCFFHNLKMLLGNICYVSSYPCI